MKLETKFAQKQWEESLKFGSVSSIDLAHLYS